MDRLFHKLPGFRSKFLLHRYRCHVGCLRIRTTPGSRYESDRFLLKTNVVIADLEYDSIFPRMNAKVISSAQRKE